MFFPTIMFWVWMAAQSGNVQRPCLGLELACNPEWPLVSTCPMYHNTAPAEHVIEIRTKRDAVPMIEITSYSEINGKLWACPVGSEMTSEMEGEPAGENTHWITYCKRRERGQ